MFLRETILKEKIAFLPDVWYSYSDGKYVITRCWLQLVKNVGGDVYEKFY